ncbi:MAG TPA: hypothetical protein VMY77_05910, partial [Chitinophagaceae bacterium]|nr:hypothetical protein [Chitinophagaceae bacterium]
MKAKLFSVLSLFIGLTIVFPAYSQEINNDSKHEPKFKKQKSYSKSYGVSSSDRINLDNQFGEMKLITWEKNEVKVDASITAMSDDQADVQKLLDQITVTDEKSGNSVSFKTKFASDKESKTYDKNKHVNQSMKINYTVYLPAGNPLNAKNQFGPMIVPDYRGEATLESQFGSLTTGKITNAKNIKVGFGKASLGQINNGRIDIQYSTGTINKLVGDVDLKLQFSGGVKVNVDNDVKSLDIDNSYSTLYLDLSKNLSASYNISTSYGSFKNKSN